MDNFVKVQISGLWTYATERIFESNANHRVLKVALYLFVAVSMFFVLLSMVIASSKTIANSQVKSSSSWDRIGHQVLVDESNILSSGSTEAYAQALLLIDLIIEVIFIRSWESVTMQHREDVVEIEQTTNSDPHCNILSVKTTEFMNLSTHSWCIEPWTCRRVIDGTTLLPLPP